MDRNYIRLAYNGETGDLIKLLDSPMDIVKGLKASGYQIITYAYSPKEESDLYIIIEKILTNPRYSKNIENYRLIKEELLKSSDNYVNVISTTEGIIKTKDITYGDMECNSLECYDVDLILSNIYSEGLVEDIVSKMQ